MNYSVNKKKEMAICMEVIPKTRLPIELHYEESRTVSHSILKINYFKFQLKFKYMYMNKI